MNMQLPIGLLVRHRKSGMTGYVARHDGSRNIVAADRVFCGSSGLCADGFSGEATELELRGKCVWSVSTLSIRDTVTPNAAWDSVIDLRQRIENRYIKDRDSLARTTALFTLDPWPC